ncbi:MAG: homocysteine S-methyltransferase family protein [Lentisphaerae bacterium]|nr:homocysteine S-methyltransferase family protein [Lentisphaerota bacterium]
MPSIIQKLKAGLPLISDGAWGTMLQQSGLTPGECPELWCLTHRDKVLAIARAYVEAGADMIETNSFGGTRYKLEFFGLAERVREINLAAAAISREAAGPERLVLGSMGPTGKMLLMGDVTPDDLYQAFKEQALALAEGGADVACIETMSDLEEAGLALRAVRENTTLEAVCTLTFERNTKGEYRTMMGVSPTQAAEFCLQQGAQVIGANCGNGFDAMVDVVREMRAAAPQAPILVHANAGAPQSVNGQTVFNEKPADAAARVPALLEAGANIIGGCCGTTPEHIAALAAAVRSDG